MRLPAFLNRASLLALLCSLYNNEYASSFDFKNTSSTGFGLDMYWNDTISLANGGIAQNRRTISSLPHCINAWSLHHNRCIIIIASQHSLQVPHRIP
jgi:hypothetical protein